MPELQICLLGSFEVSWDFNPVPPSAWRSPYAVRLLKLILLRRPQPVPPEEAVVLVGGGMVRADLGTAVEHIRRVLEPGASIMTDGSGALSFQAGPRCWIDVDALLSHYDAGLSASTRGEMLPAILAFQEADAIYQGDLLDEIQEPWVEEPRARLQHIYTDILDRLAEGHAVLARYQDAVGFCHKALSHAPLREETYQRMMVYYYYLGDLSGAADSIQACREAMEEAGRQISPETEALWGRLSRCELPGGPGTQAAAAEQRDSRRPKA